jgi:hypothetical protein
MPLQMRKSQGSHIFRKYIFPFGTIFNMSQFGSPGITAFKYFSVNDDSASDTGSQR